MVHDAHSCFMFRGIRTTVCLVMFGDVWCHSSQVREHKPNRTYAHPCGSAWVNLTLTSRATYLDDIYVCIYIYIFIHVYITVLYTSRTAQGGGGSFKNRKPIGDVLCCESGMAERIHCWTDRRLISVSLFLWSSTRRPT